MNKSELLLQMIEILTQDKAILLEATRATLEAATHEENKPENEYDTRGLEASYLAGAQSKRVAEIEEAIAACKFAKPRDFNEGDPIAPTALVELESDGKTSLVFMMPKGGGMILKSGGKTLQVVTGTSPLGEALLGQRAGDSVVVETGAKSREYDIIKIW